MFPYPGLIPDLFLIKQQLLANEISDQVEGLNRVLTLVSSRREETVKALIDADLIEVLCQCPLCSLSTTITEILYCFNGLLDCEVYIDTRRLRLMMDSLVRSSHAFLNMDNELSSAISCFYVISRLVSRSYMGVNFKFDFDLSQLTNLLEITLERDSLNWENLCELSTVVSDLLNFNDFLSDEYFVSFVGQLLARLRLQVASLTRKRARFEVVVAASIVGSKFLERSIHSGTIDGCSATVCTNFFDIVIKVIIPTLTKIDLKTHNAETINYILKSIQSVYNHFDFTAKVKLSKTVMTSGLLKAFPLLESLFFSDYEALRFVLIAVLTTLSQAELNLKEAEEVFATSFDSKNSIKEAFSRLSQTNEQAALAVIFFNYFLLLQSKEPKIEFGFFEDLCKYILSIETPPPAVTKAIWLPFAVGYLSYQAEYIYCQRCAHCLLRFISSHNLQFVLTRHKAILFWTFQADFSPQEIKKKVLKIWFEEEACLDAVLELLRQNKESRSFLIEIWCSDDTRGIDACSMALFDVMNSSEQIFKETTEEIWNSLPKVLAKTSSSTIESILRVVSFCIEYTYNAQADLLLRIVDFIPLLTSELLQFTSPEQSKIKRITFKFVSVILRKDVDCSRVVSTLLNNQIFLDGLGHFLKASNDPPFILIQVVERILSKQKEFEIQVPRRVVIGGDAALRFLMGDRATALSTIKTFNLSFENINSFLVMEPPDLTQLRAMYIRVHMLCLQSSCNVAKQCWACLRHLFTHSIQVGLHHHLAASPFTVHLLMSTPETSVTWPDLIQFFDIWAQFQPQESQLSLEPTKVGEAVSYVQSKKKFVE